MPEPGGFGAVLLAARLRAGLSQYRLGRLAGLDDAHISRLESGARGPSREGIVAIAEALGFDQQGRMLLLMAGGFATDAQRDWAQREMLYGRERHGGVDALLAAPDAGDGG